MNQPNLRLCYYLPDMRGTFDPRKIERKWFLDSARGKQNYGHLKIERKWQSRWEKAGIYRAQDFSKKDKQYILIEFPYPSGERLHVGHGRSYCCLDTVARLQRMRGYNVLFPIGWDAFGLPAENYALKTGIHPSITTKENVANAKKQAQSWGLSFDWEREINTTDSEYYRWTQWIFLQLYKKGLAYKAEIPVNWCPKDKINLANEEVVEGRCERCGTPVTRRMQSQWLLKITDYADRLIDDLEKVDYRSDIKAQQVNWIGRSEGVRIEFKIQNSPPKADQPRAKKVKIPVFTTRPDTLYGVTFLVLSPEKAQHGLSHMPEERKSEVEDYIQGALKKSELQRQEERKEKAGVFTGLYAQHPLTGNKLPIWVAEFVLSGYGTGAVMAVPAHDQRDFEFAKKYALPIQEVIEPADAVSSTSRVSKAFEGEGTLVNSAQFDGLQSKEASGRITQFLIGKKLGQKVVDYKLRDWVFSRQHYWGEPIPIIFCRKCWEVKRTRSEIATPALRDKKSKVKMQEGYDYVKIDGKEYAIVTVSEENLPVKLPYLENYKPTKIGESPLASVPKWVEARCPTCNSQARRETDTMPNWAGSSWYYLAYTFWHKLGSKKSNETPEALTAEGRSKSKKFENAFLRYRKEIDYWMGPSNRDAGHAPRSPERSRRGGGGVDWYNGGMEHTTLHLLYSRFWYKFLYDQKLVPSSEPYTKRTSHGVVLGPDGQKMSKSRGNVVNPDEVIDEFGADTFRMYEAFMGPFEQTIAWDPKGVLGVRRFLDKVWKVHQQVLANREPQTANHRKPLAVSGSPLVLQRSLHRLIKKVEEDTLSLKFNTAVAEMMKFINEVASNEYRVAREDWGVFLRVLAPYAPHLTEELYQSLEEIENKMKPHSRLNAHSAFPSVKSQKFGSIHQQPWPKYDPKLIAEETVTVVVQINGRLRGRMEVPAGTGEAEITEFARQAEPVASHLHGRKVAKTIFIPDNLINFVTI